LLSFRANFTSLNWFSKVILTHQDNFLTNWANSVIIKNLGKKQVRIIINDGKRKVNFMTKICVINIQAEEIAGLFSYYAQQVSAKVLDPTTKVNTKSPKPGVDAVFVLSHPYVNLLNKRGIIEKIIEAEREGYDAAVVHCFADPGVREAKAVVNIPVIGPGESSLHLACLLGYKFGIVTVNDPKVLPDMENMIRFHGLEERAITNPIRFTSMPLKEFAAKGESAHEEVVTDILAKAKECVADGAEVVIIGCTGLGPLLTQRDISRIEELGVPVLDCLAVALKTAETMVDLRTKLGLPAASRIGMYALPREKDLKRVRLTLGLDPSGSA
jgi:Asp/Glu/hydantoin racemase